ncbi:TspO and MBR like protein [Hylemonella gracilis ATCC 19624]|uniref:TspO and MBR like protein n=2 Tax=Hylemonella gracilis TaxID=80880 RepID=F3KQ15_9BURK|nr:TspO and MBR like protein [Hylemonella gracilis ATCC 19624]
MAWLALAFTTAAVGAVASVEAGSFYRQLLRPEWAPPASAFGPVWTVLYLMMGVAAWLAWRERGAARLGLALGMFVAQLIVNALWSWLFFVWHLGAWAFLDALLLLALVAGTMTLFWRIHRLAGLLLLPYLAWVGFASALTWSVWRNNPTLLF